MKQLINGLLLLIIALCFVLFLSIALSSCSTLKLDKKRIALVSIRNPLLLKEYCANNFKGKDSVYKEVKYLPGKIDTIKGKTIIVDCDSIIKSTSIGKKVTVKCPPSTIKIDTIFDHQYYTIESPQLIAKNELLNDSIVIYRAELNKKNLIIFKLRKFKFIVFGIIGFLVLILALKYVLKWKSSIRVLP